MRNEANFYPYVIDVGQNSKKKIHSLIELDIRTFLIIYIISKS